MSTRKQRSATVAGTPGASNALDTAGGIRGEVGESGEPRGLSRFGGFENLNDQLSKRPGREELVEKNILKSESILNTRRRIIR